MVVKLDLESKSDEYKATQKLGINKSKIKFIRQCAACLRPLTICASACKLWSKTDGNLYTYDGWSARNCYNYVWLLVLSSTTAFIFIIAFIIPRLFYRYVTEPDNSAEKTSYEILSQVASILIPIAILFWGAAIIGLWNIYHNWIHDINEREEYHKDIAKILYRTKLDNLFERIELKIEERLNIIIPELVTIPSPLPLSHEKALLNSDLTVLKSKRRDALSNLVLVKSEKFKKIKAEELKRLNNNMEADKLRLALDLLLWDELKNPNVNNEIEETIVRHINDATKTEKNPIEDVSQYAGESLQIVRIRRAYIKRDVGVKIRKEIEEKQRGDFYWHYGFFKRDNWWGEKPNKPSECLTFEVCYSKSAISDKVKKQLTV